MGKEESPSALLSLFDRILNRNFGGARCGPPACCTPGQPDYTLRQGLRLRLQAKDCTPDLHPLHLVVLCSKVEVEKYFEFLNLT